jgi:putative transcriptional regulator
MMTITHHPSDALLLDYASGALGEAWSLAIATHLALCPACRRAVSDIEALGGSFLEASGSDRANASTFDAVLARLDAVGQTGTGATSITTTGCPTPALPQPLRGYVGTDSPSLQWKRLGLGAYHLPITTRDGRATARLLRIPAGRPVPAHGHHGLELTLLLSGAFSDSTGFYTRGDLQEADDSLEHQPNAAPDEDCICLAVTEAPLRFRNFAARIAQPLLGI